MTVLLITCCLLALAAEPPATPATPTAGSATLAAATERFDVHTAMRDGSQQACELCHGVDDSLLVPAAQTCQGCHYKTIHSGLAEHMVALSPAMLAVARTNGVPLDGDKGACVSCHDAHPAGSVEHRPAGDQARAVSEPWRAALLDPAALVQGGDMLRLPLQGGALCQACHGSGPAGSGAPPSNGSSR